MRLVPTYPGPARVFRVDPIDWALKKRELGVVDDDLSAASSQFGMQRTSSASSVHKSGGRASPDPTPGVFQLFGGELVVEYPSNGGYSTTDATVSQLTGDSQEQWTSQAPLSADYTGAPVYPMFQPPQPPTLASICNRPAPPPEKKARQQPPLPPSSSSSSSSSSSARPHVSFQQATLLSGGSFIAPPRAVPETSPKADKADKVGRKRQGRSPDEHNGPSGAEEPINVLSKGGRSGARVAMQHEVLARSDFEGLHVSCRNAGKSTRGLQTLVQAVLELQQGHATSPVDVSRSSVGMVLVWRDLTSNHETVGKRYCTPTIDCPRWYCACDRHLRCEQGRRPIMGALFYLPSQAHSAYVYFLPLAPCREEEEGKENSAPSAQGSVFAHAPELPLRVDTSTEERWAALWEILTAPVFKVLYNAQLAMLPLAHTFHRLGRNACEIRMLLDVRHATYVLSSDGADGQLELNAILGGSAGVGGAAGVGAAAGGAGGVGPVAGGGGSSGKVARAFGSLHRQLARIVPLMSILQKQLDALSNRSWKAFVDVEMRMTVLLACLEDRGISADDKAMGKLEDKLNHAISQIVASSGQLMAAAGHAPFNLASPDQCSHAFYDLLHLPAPAKTSAKGKHLSTSEPDLARIVDRHPIVQLILDFRSLMKTKSTFLEGGKNFYRCEDADETDTTSTVDGPHWRVHAEWKISSTRTSRLSCCKPNLQQYPKYSNCAGIDINVRAFFKAGPGKVMVAADYSQIEVRVLAHFCRDSRLCQVFASGPASGGQNDVYLLMAAMLFPNCRIGEEERKRAKVLCIATLYGLGAEKAATDMGVSVDDARKLQAAFFNTFPGIKAWMGQAKEKARQAGHSYTLLGFARALPDLHSADGNKRAQAERQCVNSIVQGSAADIIKVAMLALDDTLAQQGWKGPRLLLTIHDELIFEVPEGEVDAFITLLHQVMTLHVQKCFNLHVPLSVNIEVGPDWGSLKKI